jgi:hypothetical protein
MLLTAAGQSATVLVAFATIGEMLRPTNAGKVRSMPPPAIEFMTPLIVAATMTSTRRSVVVRCTDHELTPAMPLLAA